MSFNSYKDYKIREALRTLQFLYGLAIFISVLFGSVILYLVYDSGSTVQENFKKPLIFLLFASIVGGIFSILSTNFIIKRITKTKNSESILATYKMAYYLKYALIVGPIFGNYLAFLYFYNYNFMIIAGLLLAFLISQAPTKSGISRVLVA